MVRRMEPRERALRDALSRAGIPASDQDEFVRFDLEWGGRRYGLDDGDRWGITHTNPHWANTEPGEVYAEFDEGSGHWWVVCADVHPSDMWMLDQTGRLWDAGSPPRSPGHFADVMPQMM